MKTRDDLWKLTLLEIFDLCIEMWEDIVRGDVTGSSILRKKAFWAAKYGWALGEYSDCFFCAYASLQGNSCTTCPARMVDDDFLCFNRPYGFEKHPEKFLTKLKELREELLKKEKGN